MFHGKKVKEAFFAYADWCEARKEGVGIDVTLAAWYKGRIMRVREAKDWDGESQARDEAYNSFHPDFKDDSAREIMAEYMLQVVYN